MDAMNICVVCQYYHPEPFKITQICEQLVSRGHSVHVLTGLPNYPAGEIPEEYRHGRRRRETINGVQVTRVSEIPRRHGKLGLLLNYASFAISASFKALTMRSEYDAIFVYQLSPVTMALPAVVLKRRLKRPLLLYCLDLWPESMKILAPGERSAAFRLTKALSRFIYRSCDRIAVSSPTFTSYFGTVHGIGPERISYLPQYSDELGVESRHGDESGPVRFFFTGNIGATQGVDWILEAASMLDDAADFEVHFVGDGSYLETAQRMVAEQNLEGRVIFHGRHPEECMPEFFGMADACLLTLRSENLTGLTIPRKLQTYLAAGKPVIAAIDGPAARIIDEARCGIHVPAGDVAGLARAMREFISNRGVWEEWGSNARTYHEAHHTLSRFMNDLEGLLDGVGGSL